MLPLSQYMCQISQIQGYSKLLKNKSQITNLKNKQFFYAASVQFQEELFSSQQNEFLNKANQALSFHQKGKATNIIKQVQTPHPNSFQEIEQIQYRMNIIQDQQFDQLQELKKLYSSQKQNIIKSQLKAQDFQQVFQNLPLEGLEINNPFIKKIINFFSGHNKQHTAIELLDFIMNYLNSSQNKYFKHEKDQKIEVISEKEIFDEEARSDMEKLLMEFLFVESIFDYRG